MSNKLTNKEFMELAKNKREDSIEYELLDEYKNTKEKYNFIHKKCGTKFIMTGRGFLNYSKRCPKCDNGLKYNKETFMEEANKRRSTKNYRMIDEFKGTKKKNKFIHEICGNIFEMKGSEFLYNENRCPKCAFKSDIDNESFKEKCKTKNIYNFSLISDYKGYHEKHIFRHDECGTEFELEYEKFFNKTNKCPNPKCFKNNKLKYNKVTFIESLKNKREDYEEYLIIDTYKGNNSEQIFKHIKCNNEFKMKTEIFAAGAKCPYCFPKNCMTQKEFEERLDKEFIILENFKNTKKDILFKHLVCDKTFKTKPEYILVNKQKCPYCRKQLPNSKAHNDIEDYLIKNNINHELEKTYEDLIDKSFLRFDFYLNDLDILIEYDGEQHFRKNPSSRFPEEKLKIIEKHDKMKNDYCKENNLKLYRINYKQDHIKELKRIIQLQRLSKSESTS